MDYSNPRFEPVLAETYNNKNVLEMSSGEDTSKSTTKKRKDSELEVPRASKLMKDGNGDASEKTAHDKKKKEKTADAKQEAEKLKEFIRGKVVSQVKKCMDKKKKYCVVDTSTLLTETWKKTEAGQRFLVKSAKWLKEEFTEEKGYHVTCATAPSGEFVLYTIFW